MKKSLFFALALMSAAIFTACNGDTLTPQGDTTQLWPAGKNGSEKVGYINKSGDFQIDPKFDACATFSCGYALAQKDGDFMFIDKSGKKVKAVDFENILKGNYHFYYNLYTFCDGEYYGMWDNKFNVAISADYKYLGAATKDGLIACSEDYEEYKYINTKGKTVLTNDEWRSAGSFVDGMAVVVEKSGKSDDYTYRYGVIDKKGNYIIEPQKNGLSSVGEGLLGMIKSSNGKVVLIDKEMNEIGSSYDFPSMDYSPVFSCGLIRVYKSEKGYGFINKKGEEIIPCKYYSAFDFTDNVTFVKKNSDSNWEAIDKTGETMFKLKDGDSPDGFHNGLAHIYHYEFDKETYKATYSYRYVDKQGDVVYKWTPGEDEEDYAPKSWEELNRQNIMRTEVGAIILGNEMMKANLDR